MVVYESLWGNTAAVARAIGEGLGPDTVVGRTSEISPEAAGEATLLVVGAPVHALSLPTAKSVASVANKPIEPGEVTPTTGHPLLRDWVSALPEAPYAAAAFDTRIGGILGHGGVSSLERRLKARGRKVLVRGEGFIIINQRAIQAPGSLLREGELARATAWGAHLASLAGLSPNLEG